jgi:hypothetical protein
VTPDQIPQLLAEIALADARVRRDDPIERRAQIKLWAGALADVPYDAALDAAGRHYGRSQWPVTPAEIAAIVRADARDRIERHTDPTPAASPDDPQLWMDELREQRAAVAAGQAAPSDHRAALGRRRPTAALPAGAEPPGYTPRTVAAELAALFPGRAAREQARQAGGPDPLAVLCPWCKSRPGTACQRGGRPGGARTMTVPHPARIQAAHAALTAQEAS